MVGPEFKKLRKNQGLSLQQVADGILDTSTLSRWENGKTDIQFERVIKLLRKLHVTPEEFMFLAKVQRPHPRGLDIINLYNQGKIPQLRSVCLKELYRYHNSKSENDLFFVTLACNSYLDLTDINLFSNQDKQDLHAILSEIKQWNQYYLMFFGNAVPLLEPRMLYGLAVYLAKELNKGNFISPYTLKIAANVLLDSVVYLVRQDVEKAQALLSKLDKINDLDNNLYFKIKKSFLENWFDGKDTSNVIDFCRQIGLQNLADELIEDISK